MATSTQRKPKPGIVRYEWAKGPRIKANAQAAGEAIERIMASADQEITPRTLWTEASDEQHVLHNEFEWDDAEAAALHRDERARLLMRSLRTIKVTYLNDEPVETIHRHLISVHRVESDQTEGGVYRPIAEILGDEAERIQMLVDAWRLLNGVVNRFEELDEIAGVRKAVDLLKRKVDQMRKRSTGR